jgi:predicted DNA-binding transcriptional regulator AlpA
MNPDALAYPPRGLSREEAARYIGVGPTKFDELVADRLMPRPKQIGRRTVWDRAQIDMAFTALPEQSGEKFFDQKFS